MTVLDLFRSGLDTMEIADKLGLDEARIYNMLSAYRKEEDAARSTRPEEKNAAKLSELKRAFI